MNVKFSILFLTVFSAWMISTSATRNPNNPPTGNTNAPGETTCVKSGCHGGGSYTGTVTITGVPDTVVANQSYSITLKQASNSVRAGFQLTCLDNANAACGTLTAGTGSSIGSGANSRKYARQSTPKTMANGSASWTFTWKAPATASANTIKFYYTGLAANGNGGTSGDNVFTGTHTVLLKQLVANEEPTLAESIKVFPVPAASTLYFDLGVATSANLRLINLEGQQVLSTTIRSKEAVPVQSLKSGQYVAQIEIGQQVVTKRVILVH
jgi:hypothetical protein